MGKKTPEKSKTDTQNTIQKNTPEALDVVHAVADHDLLSVDVPLHMLLQGRPRLLLRVGAPVALRLVHP